MLGIGTPTRRGLVLKSSFFVVIWGPFYSGVWELK
jgi:hypothetical protein